MFFPESSDQKCIENSFYRAKKVEFCRIMSRRCTTLPPAQLAEPIAAAPFVEVPPTACVAHCLCLPPQHITATRSAAFTPTPRRSFLVELGDPSA